MPNLNLLVYANLVFEDEDRLDVYKTWKYLAISGLLNAYNHFSTYDNIVVNPKCCMVKQRVYMEVDSMYIFHTNTHYLVITSSMVMQTWT